jgi:hypothetical protein
MCPHSGNSGLVVAAVLAPTARSADDIAGALGRLLASGSVTACCQEYARRLHEPQCLAQTCALIEALP